MAIRVRFIPDEYGHRKNIEADGAQDTVVVGHLSHWENRWFAHPHVMEKSPRRCPGFGTAKEAATWLLNHPLYARQRPVNAELTDKHRQSSGDLSSDMVSSSILQGEAA